MANDRTLEVRRAVLTALKADAGLIAIVPAASIYPMTVPAEPTWPFIKMGAPSGIPIRGACVDGVSGIFAVHGFSKGRYTGQRLVETGEDHAARIGAAIAAALDKQGLMLDDDIRLHVLWTNSQLMMDGAEAGAFHAIENFAVRTLA